MRRISDIREALDRLNSLTEDKRYIKLDEDLKGYFKNQYLKKFLQATRLNGPEQQVNKKALSMALAIAKLDPTFKGREEESDEAALNKNQGSYFDWLIRLINKGTVTYDQLMQDAHEYTDQLKAFDDQKKRNRLPADKKDIMQFKSLDALMDMLMELGAAADENTTHSDFKQDIKDIRQGLANICKFSNINNIPQSIQSVDDVLELIGENDKWEIWAAKNKYGTMLFDSWGKGAGWCVGGMLGSPRDGEQQAEAADYYFNNYAKNGGTYVCFQQKDKNASRPSNKYLITLGPNGTRPENGYSGYQFNDANNRTVDGDSSDEGSMVALAKFLKDNGLVDAMKNSKFKDLEAFNIINKLDSLERGEPFEYTDGEISQVWKDKIKTLKFKYNGETFTVNVEEHPEFLNGESANEMFNIKELAEGKPYTYDGTAIPQSLREAVKDVVFAEGEAYQVTPSNLALFKNAPDDFFAVPNRAFRGCKNIQKITMPDAPGYCLGLQAFADLPETAKVIFPRDRNKHIPIKVQPTDVNTLSKILYYDDGSLVVQPKEE